MIRPFVLIVAFGMVGFKLFIFLIVSICSIYSLFTFFSLTSPVVVHFTYLYRYKTHNSVFQISLYVVNFLSMWLESQKIHLTSFFTIFNTVHLFRSRFLSGIILLFVELPLILLVLAGLLAVISVNFCLMRNLFCIHFRSYFCVGIGF